MGDGEHRMSKGLCCWLEDQPEGLEASQKGSGQTYVQMDGWEEFFNFEDSDSFQVVVHFDFIWHEIL